MKLDTLLIWIGVALILLVGLVGPTPKSPGPENGYNTDCTLLGGVL